MGILTSKIIFYYIQEMHVTKGFTSCLLGGPAVLDLTLVKRTGHFETTIDRYCRKTFPKLFTGLSKQKENAVPFAVHTLRRCRFTTDEQNEGLTFTNGKTGVISRLDEPTNWCVRMVVVPKSNGNVRIYVNLTNLNDSVCRYSSSPICDD